MTRDSARRPDPRLADGDPGATSSEPRSEDVADPVTAGVAIERIRERGAEVRDGELETALAKLEARGDLPESDREAVADLAERLVDQLLAVPEASLREADDDDRTAETALELFG